ncbi:DNA-binding transcriptional regulator, ArsR family [Bifidobacterium bohemicum]|uniref:ArsR family transcriptional regulator n=1 Tax=Bifidobacterium bohemicum DSM 22767 TaxID=1437606 RepID=A0A086ZJK9_9BIFI|nr:metalloregulator ArsR/SmtB family transcription factor [Bifidobacterium bohemicum]KFI46709.1 ArsR family transcriptional regulator [Bifidobacterium bohemicum DSM 22767]SCB79469.1 DNA-binding transcriptional regulator, ArsR family [Bifidobacterium bohemicum]
MSVQTTLSALADPARREILQLLRQGIMNAGELAEATGLSASRLSYHLRKLREAGLVTDSRDGTTIWYEPNLTMLDDTIVWLKQLQRNEAVSKASGYAKRSVTRGAVRLDSQKLAAREWNDEGA